MLVDRSSGEREQNAGDGSSAASAAAEQPEPVNGDGSAGTAVHY